LLTTTDHGVVLLRRLLLEQLERVRRGEDPLGVRHEVEGDANDVIELPQEREKYGDGAVFLVDSIEASHVRHSPLRDRIVALLAERDA
jgi:5,5'-dehydrodivanillate O-demethylase